MRLSLTGRHVDISPNIRQLVTRRLARLERLLNDSLVSTQVVLTREKRQHRAEIVVHARGDHMLAATGSAADWPQAIGEAIEKIVQQAHTMKDKWRTRKRRAPGPNRAGEEALPVVAEGSAVTASPAAGPALAGPRAPGAAASRSAGARGGSPRAARGSAAAPLDRAVRPTRYAVKPMRVEDAALRMRERREPFIVFRHVETERLAILFERPDGRLGLIDPEL